jgi:hypothetical protein
LDNWVENRRLFHDSTNLFDFIFNSISKISQSLEINTNLSVSSRLADTTELKGQDRVLKVSELLEATEYVNPIGGKELYKKEDFARLGIDLKFHEIDQVVYDQFGKEFIPNLSIMDVLMFNGIEETRNLLLRCKIHE